MATQAPELLWPTPSWMVSALTPEQQSFVRNGTLIIEFGYSYTFLDAETDQLAVRKDVELSPKELVQFSNAFSEFLGLARGKDLEVATGFSLGEMALMADFVSSQLQTD